MPSHQRYSIQNLTHLVFIVLAVLLLASLLLMAVMMLMMGGMGAETMAMSPMSGIGMMVPFLLIVLAIGYGIYRLLRQGPSSERDPALEELRMAYSRGELTEEEFKQRREDLQ